MTALHARPLAGRVDRGSTLAHRRHRRPRTAGQNGVTVQRDLRSRWHDARIPDPRTVRGAPRRRTARPGRTPAARVARGPHPAGERARLLGAADRRAVARGSAGYRRPPGPRLRLAAPQGARRRGATDPGDAPSRLPARPGARAGRPRSIRGSRRRREVGDRGGTSRGGERLAPRGARDVARAGARRCRVGVVRPRRRRAAERAPRRRDRGPHGLGARGGTGRLGAGAQVARGAASSPRTAPGLPDGGVVSRGSPSRGARRLRAHARGPRGGARHRPIPRAPGVASPRARPGPDPPGGNTDAGEVGGP